jgi:hypothetical protein
MEYLIAKEPEDGTKLYLDREGEFGVKSLAYARVVLRTCFIYIEEARC